MFHLPSVRLITATGFALCTTACFSPGPAPPRDVLASVNGRIITAAEVDRDLGQALSQLDEQIYALKRRQLEALINEQLLADEAKAKNLSVAELIVREVTANATPIADAELDAYCAARPTECGGTSTIDQQRRTVVRERLRSRRHDSLKAGYIEQLRSRASVTIHLQPPEPFRAQVAEGRLPPRGSASALVTIVEFSDFHCPFCRRVQPTLDRLLEAYSGKVRLVYRDNPIEQLHPDARRVSEAARCANDQGRFWDFHDQIYSGPPRGSPEVLTAAAKAAGVDVARMEQCLAAGTHAAAVQVDVDDAAQLGGDATPAFFINGRSLRGAQPYEVFARVVEEELARAAASPRR